MQFLFGVLATAALFVVVYMAYTLGQLSGQKQKDTSNDDDFELQEQREKAKRIKKGFDEMMTYNENIARKG